MGGPEKLLIIVDDQQSLVNLINLSFKKWTNNNNIKTVLNTRAIEVLDYLKINEHYITVLISDQRMPEANGIDLIKTVSEKYPEIVSILMSGFSESAELGKIMEKDVFAFIQKPWVLDELRKTVESAFKLAEKRYYEFQQREI